MTTTLIVYLLVVGLAALAGVMMPKHLRTFCLTPRALCRFCASVDSCPVRHMKLSLKLEPRERPPVIRLPEQAHVVVFDLNRLRTAKSFDLAA